MRASGSSVGIGDDISLLVTQNLCASVSVTRTPAVIFCASVPTFPPMTMPRKVREYRYRKGIWQRDSG